MLSCYTCIDKQLEDALLDHAYAHRQFAWYAHSQYSKQYRAKMASLCMCIGKRSVMVVMEVVEVVVMGSDRSSGGVSCGGSGSGMHMQPRPPVSRQLMSAGI